MQHCFTCVSGFLEMFGRLDALGHFWSEQSLNFSLQTMLDTDEWHPGMSFDSDKVLQTRSLCVYSYILFNF